MSSLRSCVCDVLCFPKSDAIETCSSEQKQYSAFLFQLLLVTHPAHSCRHLHRPSSPQAFLSSLYLVKLTGELLTATRAQIWILKIIGKVVICIGSKTFFQLFFFVCLRAISGSVWAYSYFCNQGKPLVVLRGLTQCWELHQCWPELYSCTMSQALIPDPKIFFHKTCVSFHMATIIFHSKIH